MFDTAAGFAAFKDARLEDVKADSHSSVAPKSRFAYRMIAHWLEVDDDSLDVVRCDGDIAVLKRGEDASEDDEPEGNT